MSAVISTDIFCDECANWIHGGTGGCIQIKPARKKAQQEGWKLVRIEGKLADLCPDCAAQILEAKKHEKNSLCAS